MATQLAKRRASNTVIDLRDSAPQAVPAPPGPPAAPARLDMLDGMRGLMISAVVVLHSLWYFTPLRAIAPFFRNVEPTVDVFFALSGYVLTVAYGEAVRRKGYWFFAGRRLARLLPLYYFCLALTLVFWGWHLLGPHLPGLGESVHLRQYNTGELVRHATLTQSIGTHPLAWDFPSWSLSAELWASLTLGLVFFARRSVRTVLLALIAAVSMVMLWRAAQELSFDYQIWRGLAGVSLGALVARAPSSVRSPAWLSLSALVFVWVSMQLWSHGHALMVQPPIAALVVLLLARGRGPAIWLLESRPVLALGHRSYSIYLLHVPFLLLLGSTAYMLPLSWQHRIFTGWSAGLLFVEYFAFLVWLSGLTMRWVEERGQRIARRWLRVS